MRKDEFSKTKNFWLHMWHRMMCHKRRCVDLEEKDIILCRDCLYYDDSIKEVKYEKRWIQCIHKILVGRVANYDVP